ncbi:hypothetical protein GCM10009872_37640 [Actinopolymorpha rutila]
MNSVVLHVADYAAPYPGAFIAQLGMLDEELRRRGTGRCAFAFPPAAEGATWFRRQQADGSWVGIVHGSANRSMLRTARQLYEMVEETGASIIHTHFGSYDLPAALAVGRMRRRDRSCCLLWHYRTALEEDVDRRSLRRRVKDVVRYRVPSRTVDSCFAVTDALAREAALRGLGAKASAMIAGCDTEAFSPRPSVRDRVRAELGLQRDDVLVLHLGWAWRRKGGDLLVAAARMLQEKGLTRLVYVSVGAPAGNEPVRSLAFTDKVSDLHQAADIFVSASRSEGFGNGVVEAMASGTVVVATLAAGQREIFDGVDGCVAVPIADPVRLAEGIEDLLRRRSSWPALGAVNRAHVVSHYDMRSWARRMADMYEQLLRPGAVRR